MKKTVWVFTALILALLLIFRLGEYLVQERILPLEGILAVIAFLFFVLGLVLYRYTQPKNPPESKPVPRKKPEELGLTQREQEVLLELCHGLSNKEIAEKLFVSEHTVKSHVYNLMHKLEVKRRTKVIQMARELHWI